MMNTLSKNRPIKSRAVWVTLALGVVACGGNSSTTVDDDGSGGAPLGGEQGSSGGRASGDGGTAAGGRDGSGSSASDGGASVGGALEGDGGSPAGGTSSGGSASGGSSSGGTPGSGGAGGEDDHLYGLGDECETPGEFSCSSANELLALICGADKKWEVRETCESGEKCDFRAGSGVGLCQAPVEGCETNTSEPICGEQGVETCTRGGFETEVIEECEDRCVDAECVLVDDECPEGTFYECEDFEVCGGRDTWCGTEICTFGMFGLYVSPGPRTFRLPEADLLCQSVCSDEAAVGFVVTASSLTEDSALRVRLGAGWRMSHIELDDEGVPEACLEESAERCLVVPFELESGSTTTYQAGVLLHPLSNPPVVRNVVVDQVPLGTTCDE